MIGCRVLRLYSLVSSTSTSVTSVSTARNLNTGVVDTELHRGRRTYGLSSWLLREQRAPTRSASACTASRSVCTTFSVVRGLLASGARVVYDYPNLGCRPR